jgi:hypothetical protein
MGRMSNNYTGDRLFYPRIFNNYWVIKFLKARWKMIKSDIKICKGCRVPRNFEGWHENESLEEMWCPIAKIRFTGKCPMGFETSNITEEAK